MGLHEAGADAKAELAPRIERALAKGSSSRDGETAEDIVRGSAKRTSLKTILKRRGRLGGMDFATALGLMRAGVRVRRPDWDRTWSVEDGKLTVRWPDPAGGDDVAALACELHEDDILATDWQVAQ